MDFSFQLYSARNFPPLDAVLGRIVEARLQAGRRVWRALCRRREPRRSAARPTISPCRPAISASPQLLDTDAALKTAETLGIRYSLLPRHPQGRAHRQAAERLGRARRDARKARRGLPQARLRLWLAQPRFRVHSAADRRAADGHPAVKPLPTTSGRWTSPGWCKGGQDPIAWIEEIRRPHQRGARQGHRAGRRELPTRMAGPMSATARMDWQALSTAIKQHTNARYWVMEHDNPGRCRPVRLALDRYPSTPGSKGSPMDIGFQLYSARNYPLAEVLKKVPHSAHFMSKAMARFTPTPIAGCAQGTARPERADHADGLYQPR